jgi:hypothetical protein
MVLSKNSLFHFSIFNMNEMFEKKRKFSGEWEPSEETGCFMDHLVGIFFY